MKPDEKTRDHGRACKNKTPPKRSEMIEHEMDVGGPPAVGSK